MTADNLSFEHIDAKVSQLYELFDRQHRAVCEMQKRLVDLESNVRNEHAAFREDCNELFERLSLLDKLREEWSDYQETSS